MQYEEWNQLLLKYYEEQLNAQKPLRLNISNILLAEIAENVSVQDFLQAVRKELSFPSTRDTRLFRPNFAVLCAFCFCGSLRETTTEYTERMYLKHVKDALGIDDLSNWKSLWQHDCLAQPPAKFKTGWKYVRYPLFHSLLTFEDYKRIYQAANEIGIVGQTEINEGETRQIWKNVLSKKKGQQKFFEENRKDILKEIPKIIRKWDGALIDSDHTYKVSREKSVSSYELRIYWDADGAAEISAVECWDIKSKEIVEPVNEYFEKLGESKKIWLLCQSEQDSYMYSNKNRSFEEGEAVLLLSSARLDNVSYEEIDLSGSVLQGFHLYACLGKNVPEQFRAGCTQISFSGGLKLERRKWLFGAGPIIRIRGGERGIVENINQERLYEGQDINLTAVPPGTYYIKCADKTISFDICSYSADKRVGTELVWGWEQDNNVWHPAYWSPSQQRQGERIQGFITTGQAEKSPMYLLRELYQHGKMKDVEKSKNHLIKHVKRALYGK